MNAPATPAQSLVIGQPYQGGFFAGRLLIDAVAYALIIAPKAEGRHDDAPWNGTWDRVDGAQSYCDGLANTNAMAVDGSEIAQWARGKTIAGFDDWYIPAQDELELLYRNLKPTAKANYLYGRSGLNASALPPTYAYATNCPAQTPVALFQEGGAEALEPEWYWSSTQHAGSVAYAWMQLFGYGGQGTSHKDNQCRVVLVRRSPL